MQRSFLTARVIRRLTRPWYDFARNGPNASTTYFTTRSSRTLVRAREDRAEYGLAPSLWEIIFWAKLVTASLCASETGTVRSDLSVAVAVGREGPTRSTSSVFVPHAAKVMAAARTEILCFIRGA